MPRGRTDRIALHDLSRLELVRRDSLTYEATALIIQSADGRHLTLWDDRWDFGAFEDFVADILRSLGRGRDELKQFMSRPPFEPASLVLIDR